jgi:hypothetical protein
MPRVGKLNWDHHNFIYARYTCELAGVGDRNVPLAHRTIARFASGT